MATAYSNTGFDRLERKLLRLENLDPTELMAAGAEFLDRDNREAISYGLSPGTGLSLAPTIYRTSSSGSTSNAKGTFKPGPGANLTTKIYQRLSGPPLAPGRSESRVIANVKTGYGKDGERWFATKIWDDFVTRKKQLDLISIHSRAWKRRPARDVRGLRPIAREIWGGMIKAWIDKVMRG